MSLPFKIFLASQVFVMLLSFSRATDCNRTTEELLVYIKTKYNNNFRPNSTGGPVVVETEAHVFTMGAFDEQKMEFSMDMFFRQRWFDERLCYRPNPNKTSERFVLIPQYLNTIWRPDIFFKNSRITRFHDVPYSNVMLVVSPSGNIVLSTRLTSVLNCQMDFRRFPFDTQYCDFEIGSFANTEDDVVVKWKEGSGIILDEKVEVLQFVIKNITSQDAKGIYNTGIFSEPKTIIQFERRLLYYIFGYYVPSFLIFILSWISLWIDPRSVPARVSLGIITILAMGSFLNNTNGPKVAYATAMDIYVITCYVFVFVSLLEYALVHYGITFCEKLGIDEHKRQYNYLDGKEQNGNIERLTRHNQPAGDSTFSFEENKATIAVATLRKYKIKYLRFNAYHLENYARIGLLLAFCLFNLGYWVIYAF